MHRGNPLIPSPFFVDFRFIYYLCTDIVWRVEGKQTGLWVAMDYMDVVVHIFTTELRSFYKLEELWADAPLKRYDYEE